MRLHNKVAAGSPAMRLTYVVILTLLLAILATGTVVAGASLMPGPATIVVAPDGSGDYLTITEAVAAAQDGDTVLVKPGTYLESVLIDTDITLKGDGPAGSVVIEFGLDSATVITMGTSVPSGLRLVDTDARVSNLTVRGPNAGSAIWMTGGAPTLDAVTAGLTGDFAGRPYMAFHFTGGTRANVRDSTALANLMIDQGAAPTIDRLDSGMGAFIEDTDTRPVIRDSRFESGLDITGGAEPTLEGNDLIGVLVQGGSPIVRGNTLHNPGFVPGSEQDASEEEMAIEIVFGEPLIVGNVIREHDVGISLSGGSTAIIQDNAIEANTTGITVVGPKTLPILTGNAFCGNATNLDVPDGSTLTLDGNTVCGVAPSPAP